MKKLIMAVTISIFMTGCGVTPRITDGPDLTRQEHAANAYECRQESMQPYYHSYTNDVSNVYNSNANAGVSANRDTWIACMSARGYVFTY
jgi:hypothetical protein